MATTKPQPGLPQSGPPPYGQASPGLAKQPRRSRMWRALPWLALVVLALAAIFGKRIGEYAETGAAYGARIGCSCHYVGGRSLSDCRDDFEPGMELVTLSADADDRSVTARFAFLASDIATFTEGAGCVLARRER